MNIAKSKKAIPGSDTIKNSIMAARFVHVVYPDQKVPDLFVAITTDNGKLDTYKVADYIYNAVLGTMTDSRFRFLGLRQLTKVAFHLHFDDEDLKEGKVVGVDVVPNRMFVRGTSPVEWGEALTKGFKVAWDETIHGFRVDNAYVGMTAKTLTDLLLSMRKQTWKNRSTATIDGHKVERRDDSTYHVTPINPRHQFTRPT